MKSLQCSRTEQLLCTLVVIAFLFSSVQAQQVERHCVTFESLPADTSFGASSGNSARDVVFSEDGISVSVENYRSTDAGPDEFGDVKIVDRSDFNFPQIGGGQVASFQRASLRLKFPDTSVPNMHTLTFQYFDDGPPINIQVNNGDLIVQDIKMIGGRVSGGVIANVAVNPNDNRAGTVTLTGNIDSLLLGGEEFFVDSLCFRSGFESECMVEILHPEDGQIVCGDKVHVEALVQELGVDPATAVCTVNGMPVTPIGGVISTEIPVTPGSFQIIVECEFDDPQDEFGGTISCADTVNIEVIKPASCAIRLDNPEVICDPNGPGYAALVTGEVVIFDGLGPFDIECEVNGVMATMSGTNFTAIVPISGTAPVILEVKCRVVDLGCNLITFCEASTTVFPPSPLQCAIDISSPTDDFVCSDAVVVIGTVDPSGGFGGTTIVCNIDGNPVPIATTTFSETVDLEPGDNTIPIECTVTDACGVQVVCRDTVRVHFDAKAPRCKFRILNGNKVVGNFTDEGSGMDRIEVEIENGIVEIDHFTPGATRVEFTLTPDPPGSAMPFTLTGFDLCGRKVSCDPVFVSLSTDGARQMEFTFKDIDRYFQLTNYGLDEIRVDLNGNKFKLTTGALTEPNVFAMPVSGTVTIDLAPYLRPGDNEILMVFDGAPGTRADLFLIDIPQFSIDFVLELATVPEDFQLAQNYPNPFNPTTTIQYDIPAQVEAGVSVQLNIYNVMGELVRTLVEEPKTPGRYTVEWDARDNRGLAVSSGIYIYRIVAGGFKQTNRMVILK